jgi:hypothetical protein
LRAPSKNTPRQSSRSGQVRTVTFCTEIKRTPIYAVDAGSLPEGIGPLLQATIESEAAVLRPHLAGPRHVEAFMPCAW